MKIDKFIQKDILLDALSLKEDKTRKQIEVCFDNLEYMTNTETTFSDDEHQKLVNYIHQSIESFNKKLSEIKKIRDELNLV